MNSHSTPQLLCISTTVAHLPEAQAMARAVVEAKLAACAHISPITSVFFWEGSVQEQSEFQVVFKTTVARYEAVVGLIKQLHAYELPAIDAVALERADPVYAAWVIEGSGGI